MPSSGRQYDNLIRLFAPVKDDIAYICQNGASAWAEGEVLFRRIMDGEAASRLIEEVKDHPEAEIMLSSFEACYVEAGKPEFFHLVHDVVGMRAFQAENLQAHAGSCTKISLYEEAGISDCAYWQERFGDSFTVVPGGAQWLDMMAKDVNKGSALRDVLSFLKIDPQETVVFGDNLNDYEIMKMAGLAVTVPGGVNEIQAVSHVVTETVEQMLEEILAGRDQIEDWKRAEQ